MGKINVSIVVNLKAAMETKDIFHPMNWDLFEIVSGKILKQVVALEIIIYWNEKKSRKGRSAFHLVQR